MLFHNLFAIRMTSIYYYNKKSAQMFASEPNCSASNHKKMQFTQTYAPLFLFDYYKPNNLQQ